MDSPGATTGAWLMLGWPGVGRGYNLGRKVPERSGNVRENQRGSPCNVRSGGDHGDQTFQKRCTAACSAGLRWRWRKTMRDGKRGFRPELAVRYRHGPRYGTAALQRPRGNAAKALVRNPHNAIARHAVPSPGVVDSPVCRQPPPIHVVAKGRIRTDSGRLLVVVASISDLKTQTC